MVEHPVSSSELREKSVEEARWLTLPPYASLRKECDDSVPSSWLPCFTSSANMTRAYKVSCGDWDEKHKLEIHIYENKTGVVRRWKIVIAKGSRYCESRIGECAIDSPPRGAPWETYTHTAKKSLNRQLTLNYHDLTVCHIRPLPQYSPHLTFFSTFLFYLYESLSISSLDFCDFDVLPLPSVKPEVN
nr:hypothetical transcript [Hymenolepis microstoma]